MYPGDFESFSATMRQLSETFGKPLNDAMVQSYWGALKDQPLSTVTRCAENHTKHGKFFPKPVELRPKDGRPAVERDAAMEAAFRDGEQRAVAYLEELKAQDEAAWRNDVWLRKLDRILATQPENSPIYAQALEESRRLRPLVRGY